MPKLFHVRVLHLPQATPHALEQDNGEDDREDENHISHGKLPCLLKDLTLTTTIGAESAFRLARHRYLKSARVATLEFLMRFRQQCLYEQLENLCVKRQTNYFSESARRQ